MDGFLQCSDLDTNHNETTVVDVGPMGVSRTGYVLAKARQIVVCDLDFDGSKNSS